MSGVLLTLRSLRRRPRRAVLSIAATTVAAATYIVLLTLGDSLTREVTSALAMLRSEIVVQQAGSGFPTTSWLTRPQIHGLQTLPGVRRSTLFTITVTRVGEQRNVIVFGLGPGLPDHSGLRYLDGRAFDPGAEEVVLGRHTAEVLGLSVGDRVELRRRELTVVGIFESGRPLLDRAIVLPMPLMQNVFDLGNRVNLVFLELYDPDVSESVQAAVESRFPELEVGPVDDLGAQYEQLDITGVFVRHLAFVALLITALGVSNVATLNVSDRIGEFGVLRAIGWKRRRLLLTVMAEGAITTVFGAVMAPLFALILLGLLPVADTLGYTSDVIAASTVIEAALLTIVAGVVGGLPGGILAARVQPARALRAD